MEAEETPDRSARARPARPEPVQETLPFAADDPIPFALTARARRVVAPGSLPSLRVLGDEVDAADDVPASPQRRSLHDAVPVDLDDPNDTRPSRARALRRAGVEVDAIAHELGADELVVRAWVDEVEPVRSARRRLRAVAREPAAGGATRAAELAAHQRAVERYATARAAAREAAAERLDDPAFTTGLGLVVGLADLGRHAAALTVRDRDVAAAVVRWLTGTAGVPRGRVRVLLRIAPQAAGDLAAHAWAEALGVPAGQVSYTRWRAAPHAEAQEATIRIGDPAVSATLAGWRDALLGAVTAVSGGANGGANGGADRPAPA